MAANYDYLFKVVLAGDTGVGKSSILSRYADDVFTESYISTIGVDFKIQNLTIDGKKVKLQLWDTAGQERFRTITRAYYRGAHGVVLIFDLTSKKSFDRLSTWVKETRDNTSTAKIIVLGNKSDLDEQRAVTKDEGAAFAAENELDYYEVSAKNGSDIDTAFKKIAESIRDSVGVTQQSSDSFTKVVQLSDEEDDEDFALDEDEKVLDEKNATDTEVLTAVGDPCTIVEYVSVIRRQFFELQNLKKQLKDRQKRG